MATYKCIPVEHGVDVSINRSNFFTFKNLTHVCTDLGANRVRVSRKIDGLHELYNAGVEEFVDMDGVPVASTYEQLNTYLNQNQADVKAGEGISVDGSKVSVVAGGPATLGGFKVGTGLQVDGDGRLSASASSEVTKVLATEAEMLGLMTEPLRPYRVIRLDTNRLYFLNTGDSPAVLSNWFTGPSLDQVSISFNGRTGVVLPAIGDYTTDLVTMTDKTAATTHKFVFDAGKLYVENVTTLERIPIGADADIAALSLQFQTLNDIVTNASTGLQTRLGEAETKLATIDQTVNNATTGLAAKVAEQQTKVDAISTSNKDLESLVLLINDKADNTAANTVVLDQRLSSAETEVANKADKTYVDSTFIPSAQKAAVNGIAPLDDSGKVPLIHLPEIPSGGGEVVTTKSHWKDVLSQRSLNTWFVNTDKFDRNIYLRLSKDTWAGPSRLEIQKDEVSPVFTMQTNSISATHSQILTTTIPQGYRYRVIKEGAGRNLEAWYELEYQVGSTFTPVSEKGQVNGVAPLGPDGKIDPLYLPENVAGVPNREMFTYTAPQREKDTTYLNDTGAEIQLFLNSTASTTTAFLTVIVDEGKAKQTIINSGNIGTNQGHRQFITATIPPGSTYKVTNRDPDMWIELRRVSTMVLPAYKSTRTWKDVKAQRTVGSWYLNDSSNEMMVHVRAAVSSTSNRFVSLHIRENATSPAFIFNSTVITPMSSGNAYADSNTITVPPGWQYSLVSTGGSTDALTERWYELS